MAINGGNIIIEKYVGSSWVAIAGTKSDDIQVDGELIEIASPTTGTWKSYISGKKSWGLTVNWLLSAVSDVKSVLQVGDRVKLRIGGANGMEGYAYIKTAKVTATKGSLANGSFSFVGDGELAQVTE